MRTAVPLHAVMIPREAERVFHGIIHDIYQWQQLLYDGTYTTFEMLKRPDVVKVFAVIDDKELVVLEQEQPRQSMFYDIPGGWHDNPDEDELSAIQRELQEEAGLTFKSWRLLSVVQPHRTVEQFIYTFLATDLESETVPHGDGGERITVHRLPFAEAKALLAGPQGRYFPQLLMSVDSMEQLLGVPSYPGWSPG